MNQNATKMNLVALVVPYYLLNFKYSTHRKISKRKSMSQKCMQLIISRNIDLKIFVHMQNIKRGLLKFLKNKHNTVEPVRSQISRLEGLKALKYKVKTHLTFALIQIETYWFTN